MPDFRFQPHWLVFMILYLIIFIIYFFSTLKRRAKWLNNDAIVNAFFIFYLLAVAYLVFTPISIWTTSNQDDFVIQVLQREPFTWWEIANINLIPFRSLVQTLGGLRDGFYLLTLRAIGGNFIMLFPLPIFLGLLSKRALTFKKVVIIGFCTTLFIESMQLVINLSTRWPNRLVCVDDLLLNTLGVIVGYLVYKKWYRFFQKIISIMYKFLTHS